MLTAMAGPVLQTTTDSYRLCGRRRTTRRATATHAAIQQERARIARELHDSVSQTLYAITLTASRARSLLKRNESAAVQHIIEDVLQLATTGQTELRALITDIRSDEQPSVGLADGLAQLAEDVRTRNSLDVRVS